MRIDEENKTATPPEIIRIAARKSDLARLQAFQVGDRLGQELVGTHIDYAFRESLGDVNQQDPLWKMPEKGVFTEDFLKDLETGTADLVVHSWKDLPTEPRERTEIAATLPRADQRDLLLFRADRLEAAAKSGRVRVLTSSPRRAHNLDGFLRKHLPFPVRELEFVNVRGNIPTRLRKLFEQDVEILIVAKAAIDRLLTVEGMEFAGVKDTLRRTLARTRFMVLPLSINPTAAAQGALAIEIENSRDDLRTALNKVNCGDTFAAVTKEREILAAHGGGCHQKIGVSILRRPYGEITFVRGLTHAGVVLDEIRLDAWGPRAVRAKAESETSIFPRKGEEATFFDRETLGREAWSWAEKERFLWVARETAWPKDFNANEDAIIWTAGVRSWEKLAARGIWVSGTSDSLGEDEPTLIDVLIDEPQDAIKWTKLTHADSADRTQNDARMKACATYRLQPKQTTIDLTSRTHFFWMSGSAFDRALELFPSIRDAQHACGPGLTLRHLKSTLGARTPIGVYLSPEAWRRDVTKDEESVSSP